MRLGGSVQAAQQNEDSLHAKNIPSFEPPSATSNTVLHLPPPIHQSRAQNQNHDFDRTGQIAPPGIKPRVTTSLWEDEGSLCFQVEARGIVVARRQDNSYINGTKLLNVAGMTRGRRDGILEAENIKHVVKIGSIHLKGVWIPFERALDFANREKITPLLYPLFVHDTDTLLYHPTDQNRGNQIMATAECRKQQQAGDRKNEKSLGHTSHGRGIVEAQHQMSPGLIFSPESDSDSSSSGEFLAREKRKDMLTYSLMNYFFRIFRSCRSSLTPSRVKTHGTGIDRTTTGMNIDSASTLTSRSSQTLKKRERTEDKGDEDEDYVASDGRGKRPRMGDPLPRPKRLACPYFKKDPVRFQTKQSCCGPSWETVHRLQYTFSTTSHVSH
ncbi:transcription regulator HTH, apses-type DNA-binding domain-containing protein [Xylaria acuta]|nr:transcription regulator HTH, apses-type DNA-binding domain-containing protein [Xylaria acuta]